MNVLQIMEDVSRSVSTMLVAMNVVVRLVILWKVMDTTVLVLCCVCAKCMNTHLYICLLLVPYCLRFCHENNIVSSSDNSHWNWTYCVYKLSVINSVCHCSCGDWSLVDGASVREYCNSCTGVCPKKEKILNHGIRKVKFYSHTHTLFIQLCSAGVCCILLIGHQQQQE